MGRKALEGDLEWCTLVCIWSLLEWNFFKNGWCDLVIYSDGIEVSSCHIGLGTPCTKILHDSMLLNTLKLIN